MLALMATLPGVPLYRALGFREQEQSVVTMPDGVIHSVAMDRPIQRPTEPYAHGGGHCWTGAIPLPFRIRDATRSTQMSKIAISRRFARPPLHCGEGAREAFETGDLRGL